jgi:uncharacterized protein DUF6362
MADKENADVIVALDRPVTHQAARWSAELVRQRLIEAFEIEAKLPGPRGRRPGSGSAWPAMAREFGDLVGWSDEARLEIWEGWQRTKVAFPYEVSRYEETITWLAILKDHPGEQRCLVAWAKLKATPRRASLRKLMRRTGWARSTFHRRRDSGAARIAEFLNSRGVAVR